MADMSIPWEDLSDFRDLSSGSFGVVRRADYLGTDVAVKEFLDISDQPGFDVRKYIGREVDILKESRHPNVVQVRLIVVQLLIGYPRYNLSMAQFMGSCVHDNKVYLVTEFVPGGNLKQWILDTTKEFPWRLRISFATDIARALAYLHAHKIIHRDLKSENLLITENRRIKICDFGFSREAARTTDERRKLSFCGTDAYMAPEIMLGMSFDETVDIFSFGVILCEILTRTVADAQNGVDPVIQRVVPGFGVDRASIERVAGEQKCPSEFLEIAVACADDEAKKRPKLKDVLAKLRALEAEVVREEASHVGVLH
ncbi:hypothetical protein HK104_008351, partial [Borealophlyctis nickersoniae]